MNETRDSIRRIKIHTLSNMFYTPFSQHHRDPEDPDSHAGCMCINDWGRGLFVPTDDRVDADVLVGFNHKEPDPSKINLIWTHEPSVNLSFQPVQYQNGVPIYVFNLYCMNIYQTNAYYFIPKVFHPIEYVGVADVAHKFHNKRILMCSSYFSQRFSNRVFTLVIATRVGCSWPPIGYAGYHWSGMAQWPGHRRITTSSIEYENHAEN